MPKTIIIGAGLTGLSCAYYLKHPYLIYEKQNKPGGLCGSVRLNGFTFDYSGHFIHLRNQHAKDLVNKLLSKNITSVERNAFISAFDKYIPFPFQANLFKLPKKIKEECVNGIINRVGTEAGISETFYKWSLATFGKGITKYFMKPYNEKLWSVSSNTLTADWVAPFVPKPSMNEVIEGAKRDQKKKYGYNVSFFYPKHGGCQAFVDSFLPYIEKLNTSVSVEKVDPIKRCVVNSFGETVHYNSLVSTQPLPELLKQIVNLPKDVKSAAGKLAWASVFCVNAGFKAGSLKNNARQDKHWIYFPEKKYPFYRVGIYSNISRSSVPKGCFSFYIESSRNSSQKLNGKNLANDCLKGLKNCGLIDSKDELLALAPLDMPYAYVIYDKNRTAALKTINEYLVKNKIYSIGRYGAWKYSFMEESILDAMALARQLNDEN